MMRSQLKDLMPAVGFALGAAANSAPTMTGRIPASRCVVVLLVDGMGYLNLQNSGLDGEVVRSLLSDEPGQTSVPSTTPVALATLGTGASPGHHGFVGATFELPDLEVFLRPLKWDGHPEPLAVQPEATWFENLAATGVQVTRIGPAAYAQTGLTQAVLRGGTHRAAETLDELQLAVLQSVDESAAALSQSLVYAYYPKLDKAGHVYGVDSDEWRAELVDVLQLIGNLQMLLEGKATLVVTADHGMIDAGPRLWIEDRPSLLKSVKHIAGEPRLRHIYSEGGAAKEVLQQWQIVEDVADVYSRQEFVARYWSEGCEEFAAERVGDVVAVARERHLLASRTFDSKVSSLKGQHGSDTDEECLIPIAVLAG